MIECKSATCDERLELGIHRTITSDTYFVGYCCEKCGWISFVSGPYTTYDEASHNLK